MTAPLKGYLADALGLDVDAIGAARVQEAVRRILTETGVGMEELPDYLSRHEEARHRFYESLTVPETWFMRGRPALQCLVDFARRRAACGEAAPLRVLSVPCSTGEEPYSVLMMLDLAGIPPEGVEVHAVDISAGALAVARTGVYGRYSFRGVEAELIARYFTECDGLQQFSESLRGRVRFFHANAVRADFLPDQSPYDVVVCRNLLIYLLPAARATLLGHLERLLRRDGLLLAGHSETAFFARQGWRKMDAPHAFAFLHPQAPRAPEKQTGVRSEAPPPRKRSKGRRAPAAPEVRRAAALPQPAAEKPAAEKPAAKERTDGEGGEELSTAEIRKLADAGQLEFAMQACMRYVKRHPLDAEAFCVAGLTANALHRDAEAVRWFEQALYLNPEHEETLYHLVLLYRAAGDERRAVQCARRLKRFRSEKTA